MNKEEFLILLQECLEGQISKEELVDTLAYYRNYFSEEESQGKTESEIVEFLGNPRLIAHSIIDAHEEATTGSPGGFYDVEEERYSDGNEVPMEEKMGYLANRVKAILGIILALVIGVAFLHVLVPVIIVLLVIYGIYRLLHS